jgi:hypothetical protein
MKKRLIVRTVIYLLVGVVFFLEMVNFMKFPIIKGDPTTINTAFNIDTIEQNTTKELASLQKIINNQIKHELYKKFDIDGNSSHKCNSKKENQQLFLVDRYIFFEYVFKNNNSVIPLIYLLTLVAFLVQVTLFAWSFYYVELLKIYSEKKLDTIFLYGSEWTINAPPVLGVVGTIFSFGMVVGNLADISSLSTVFKDNFPNAALTTILGGSVYVINLFINILIAKNLSNR